jgi:arylsulfatase A-like enzyme
VEFDPDDTLFTQRITKESLEFIGANKDRPFFLYMSQAQVHREVLASREFQGKSDYGVWGDAVQELDWSVGEVLKTLRELGIDENTLVIYVSDNGPTIQEKGSALPLKGNKGSTWEGGLRVPCIMRWPGKIPAGIECDETASIMDIFPTFAKLIGTSMPPNRMIDGKDIWPLMTQAGAVTPHSAYYYYLKFGLMGVRSGPWKLHNSSRQGNAEWKLYNLETDIGETTDVSAENPEVLVRLEKLLGQARADMGDKGKKGSGARPLGKVSTEEGEQVKKKFRGL